MGLSVGIDERTNEPASDSAELGKRAEADRRKEFGFDAVDYLSRP
jgi:hypothetical protein